MDTFEASSLARGFMNTHGLGHWAFQFDRAKRRAGCCKHRRQVITLSYEYVVRNNREEITDTILHEIAHALAGPGNGHNHVWKAICRRIGAKPVRCYGIEVSMPKGRWKARCNGCNREFHRHRRPKYLTGMYCTACGPQRGLLTYSMVG